MTSSHPRPSFAQVSDCTSDLNVPSISSSVLKSLSSSTSLSLSPSSTSTQTSSSHGRKTHNHIRYQYQNRFRHHPRGHQASHNKASSHEVNPRDYINDIGDSAASFVTQVIQTVSLVQIVDPAGVPYETKTIFAAPATVVVDPATGQTVEIPSSNDSTSAAVPGNNPATTQNVPPVSTATSVTVLSSSTSSLPTSLTSSSTTGLPTVPPTTTSSSTSTRASSPSRSASHNVTTPGGGRMTIDGSHRGNMTFRPMVYSQPDHTSKSTKSSPSHTQHWWAKSSSTTSDYPVSTTSAGDVNGLIGGGEQSQPTQSAQPSGDPTPGLSSQQKTIVGGVVGSVAGVAFVLLLLMVALRWKRRRDRNLLQDDAAGSRGMIAGGGGGGGGDGGGSSMVERSAPVGVSAAIAALASKRKSQPAETTDTGERGFVRVSGRKLPSVLTYGGDGFSDPRMSAVSGETDYYRGSQAFEPGTSARLALGSPMRPVSGVPIMRTGPGRTAQAETNPFADPPSPTSSPPISPPPPSDPIGRSLAGSDGSRVSASRFQEQI